MSKIRVEELETLDGLNLAKVEDLAKVGDPETGLDRRVIYVDTVADLQALDTSGLADGQQASVGEAGMLVWSGSEWLPKNSQTITVRIPTDYPTLQEAIDTLGGFFPPNGAEVELLIESGHVIASQLLVRNTILSHFKITSEDSEVTVDKSSITEAFGTDGDITYEPLFGAIRAALPQIHTVFVYDDSGSDNRQSGIALYENSSIYVAQGCGVKDFVHQGLVARSGSIASAIGSIFTCPGRQGQHTVNNGGISSWTGASVDASEADVSFCFYGARAAVGGYLRFIRGVANDCQRHALRANEGGRLNARESEGKNAGAVGINVTRNGHAEVQNADVTGAAEVGANCTNSSTCDASGVIADNCDIGFKCADASIMNAGGSTGAAAGRKSQANNCRVGYYAERTSFIQADGSEANDCAQNGYYAYRSSRIDAEQSQANNAAQRGYFADRMSEIHCSFSSAKNCGVSGAEALYSSTVEANECDFSGSSGRGVRSWVGSRMSIRQANCRKGENDSPDDIQCRSGATINATGATGGTEISVNTLTSNGIIFQ